MQGRNVIQGGMNAPFEFRQKSAIREKSLAAIKAPILLRVRNTEFFLQADAVGRSHYRRRRLPGKIDRANRSRPVLLDEIAGVDVAVRHAVFVQP